MVLGENGEIRTGKVCTYQDRFPLYYTHTVEMCKLERVSFPKSNQIPFLEPGWPCGLQEELFLPFSAPHLILPDVAEVGVGKADAQWPCATVPPSWSPVFAEFNICFLFLVTFGQLMWRAEQWEDLHREIPKYQCFTGRTVGEPWARRSS